MSWTWWRRRTRCLDIFTTMIDAFPPRRVVGLDYSQDLFSQNLPMILCDQKPTWDFNRWTSALREYGGPIYRTGLIGILSGTRHILCKEDVDTCPHLVGWPAAQAASQPSSLGIGPPVQFPLWFLSFVVPSMILVSYILVSYLRSPMKLTWTWTLC